MKRLLILLLCMVFLIGSVSAFEFDNVKKYDKETKTITITNAFGFGDTIAKAQLKTPRVFKVPVGYQKVAEFEVQGFKNYKDFIKEIELFDLKRGNKKFSRKLDLKYKDYEDILVNDYERKMVGYTTNGTAIYESKVVGSHYEKRERWIKLTTKGLQQNKNITIGIFTNVEKGDYIEWIPTFAGVRVEEWAIWTSSLDVGLVSYYKLDEQDTTGTGTIIDSADSNNGINNGTTNTTGKINTSYLFDGTNDKINLTADIIHNYSIMTINLWFKHPHQTTSNAQMICNDKAGKNNDFALGFDRTTGELWLSRQDEDTDANYDIYSDSNVSDDTWHMGTMIFNQTGMFLYVDGVIQSDWNSFWEADATQNDAWILGSALYDGQWYKGILDEIGIWNRSLTASEISDLYNSGNGLPYQSSGISVSLVSPIDNYNSTTSTIIFNGIANSTFGITNVSLILDGTYNETNSSGLNGTYIFTKTLPEGNHNWTYEVCDTTGNCQNATVRNFLIDTIYPTISISSPSDGASFQYLINQNNLTLNVTITDANLDTCWYDYNNTNTTFSCSSGVLVSRNLTITNQSEITIWANDSAGNLNSSKSDWIVNLFDFDEYVYEPNVTESSSTTITGRFQTSESLSSSYLEYNNTNYSTSIDSLGGNQYNISATVTSPTVNSNTNITWFFWVNDINATKFNQTVLSVNLDDCSSYGNVIVNYTLVDELTQSLINNANSTIESSVVLKTITGQEIAEFNNVFSGTPNATVCSETDLSSSGLRLWEQSRYGSDNYVFEQQNIQNQSISNGKTDIILRDLPSSYATTFRITYKSSTFLPVSDAVVQIQRKYIGEGTYKEVESPITDANGEASASFDLNTVIYKILIYEAGTLTGTFENPAIFCDNILTGECTIDLNEGQLVEQINNWDTENDIGYSLIQDNRTISLIFEIPSGNAKTVNLFVNQSTILGNTTSCNQTLFATSGQIDCVIDDTLGDVFFTATISVDGTELTTASGTIVEDRSTYFGTDNIVLTFFLVLSLILLMISDPITVLIGIMVGLIGSSLMLLLNSGNLFGTASVLMYLTLVVIILIVKISMRQKSS